MAYLLNLPPEVVLALAGYVALANLLALLVARTPEGADGEWQSADSRLLFLAAMGGWIGAKLGQMAFHRQGPGGSYGKVLNLSILVLPVVLAIPLLMDVVPGLVSQGVSAYSAQYAAQSQGAGDTADVVASSSDSPAASLAGDAGTAVTEVTTAATAAATTEATATAAAPALPKRFGPGSDSKHKKTTQKTLSVGN